MFKLPLAHKLMASLWASLAANPAIVAIRESARKAALNEDERQIRKNLRSSNSPYSVKPKSQGSHKQVARKAAKSKTRKAARC